MRAHIYGSRNEEGIMLIGSSGEMRALAERLVQGALRVEAQEDEEWPPEIAQCGVNGTPFKVSFHLEGTLGVPPTNVVPRTSTVLWFWGLVPLAVVGLIAIARLVANAL